MNQIHEKQRGDARRRRGKTMLDFLLLVILIALVYLVVMLLFKGVRGLVRLLKRRKTST